MPDEQPVVPSFSEEEPDEVDNVLSALHRLALSTTNPVVRACLEDACEEIAHLTHRPLPCQ